METLKKAAIILVYMESIMISLFLIGLTLHFAFKQWLGVGRGVTWITDYIKFRKEYEKWKAEKK